MSRPLRTALLYLLATALLTGGVTLAFTHPFGLPTATWLRANPGLAIGLALVTGFADGINPCAIATLLLFVGALLAVAEATTRRSDARRARITMLAAAGAYITGIFVLYYALGTGFINVTSIRIFGNTHLFTRLAALLAVLLGIGMMAEIAFPRSGIRIAMPNPFHGTARRWGRRTSMGGAFVGGVLIGTCTIPCGGAMYLAIAAVLGTLSSRPYAYGLLTTYNIAFILPLVLLVAMASSRPLLQKLSRLHIRERSKLKLALGAFVTAIGMFALL